MSRSFAIIRRLCGVLVLALTVPAAAADTGDPAAIARQGQQILSDPGAVLGRFGGPLPAAPDTRALEGLEALLGRSQDIGRQALTPGVDLLRPGAPVPGGQQGPAAADTPPQAPVIWVFVSEAMGEEPLRAAMEMASLNTDMALVFRGIRPDENLVDAIRRIHAMAGRFDPVPNVTIDPTAFERFGATAAPEMVMVEGERVVVRARGIFNPGVLRERLADGRRGDLGDLGPVTAFAEQDLIQVMQARAGALDMDAMKEQALGRFWKKVPFQVLPAVTKPRVRRLDPSVRITQDMRTADGTLIHRAGTVINPLDIRPFDRRLIFFNASDKRQVATAARLLRESRAARTVLIATELDRTLGWEALRDIQNGFQAPVFLLQPDLRDRFRIEAVPTLVEAVGREFLIVELEPDGAAATGAGAPAP